MLQTIRKNMKWSCFGEKNLSFVAAFSKMLRKGRSDRVMLPEAISDV